MAGIGFAGNYSTPPASAGIKSAGVGRELGFGGELGSNTNTKTALANSAIQQLLGGNSNTGSTTTRGTVAPAPGITSPRTAPQAPPPGTTNTANANPTSSKAISGLEALEGPNQAATDATTKLQSLSNPNQAATNATSSLENLSKANQAGTQATQGLFDQANNKSGLYGQIDQNIQDIRDKASLGIAGDQQGSRIQRGVSGSSIDNSDKRALGKAQQNDINRMTTDATLGWEKERSNNLQAAGNMGLNTSAQQIGAAGAAGNMGLANQAQQIGATGAAGNMGLANQAQQVGTTATAGNMGLSQGAQQLAQQQQAMAQQNQMFQQQQQQDAAIRDSQMQGWNTILNLLM